MMLPVRVVEMTRSLPAMAGFYVPVYVRLVFGLCSAATKR